MLNLVKNTIAKSKRNFLETFFKEIDQKNCIFKGVMVYFFYIAKRNYSKHNSEGRFTMATLEDIARALKVSKGTVSKALNGAADVSESMRRLVLEKAVELGYSRPLRGDAPRIAVFITNMRYASAQDLGFDILVGIRKMAEPAGYRVIIIPLNHELENSIRYDEYMMRGNYRGGLFLGLSLDDPWLKEFETCRTPTVLYDNCVKGNPRVTYVGADNAEGMELAVNYLQGLGHTKIGYLSSALGAYVYQQRYQAFFRVLRDKGLPDGESLAGNSLDLEECLSGHLPRLINQGCTAIMCSHDILAIQALARCRKLGIRVPEDVSILGFDDLLRCRNTTPPLTTIRQNRTELGKSAYCALSSQMEGVPLSTFLLHTELVKRSSCAPPK